MIAKIEHTPERAIIYRDSLTPDSNEVVGSEYGIDAPPHQLSFFHRNVFREAKRESWRVEVY
jgi:hypothetical protein